MVEGLRANRYTSTVLVTFDSDHVFKAYHDPERQTIEFVSSFRADIGQSIDLGTGVELSVDEDEMFCHLVIDLSEVEGDDRVPPRPGDAPVAQIAELEVVPDTQLRHLFDPVAGCLRLCFEGVEASEWARLGPNLVWLAIDADARLAALVIEGVSRDPGGKGLATWLADMGGVQE